MQSQVHRDGDHFLVHLQMQINAPATEVYQRLTDFNQLHQLSDMIKQSRVLETNGKQQRVEVISEGCVLIFCRRVTQIQTATKLARGYLLVIDDPSASDFHSGRTLWHIAPVDNGTRVTLSADIEPGFWVPPIIGTAIFKNKLIDESTTLINNVEQKSRNDDSD
ncbi:MAG: SRPBCC family protein [Thiohalophilus sp.]